MLFYTSLFLIIVLVLMISVWMYRAIFGVTRSAYHAKLVGGQKVSKRTQARLKARRKARLKAARSSSSSGMPTPWGWKANTNHAHSGSDVQKLGGHPDFAGNGNDFVPFSHAEGRKNVGWPYKEEKVDFAGKAYKVNRKAADGGDLGSDGKPWIW